MATPMEYDVLRECYWDTMAMFNRLTHKYHISEKNYKEDKDQYSAVWRTEINGVTLDKINYKKVLEKLQSISQPWHNFNKKLYQESKGAAKAVNA